MHPRCCCCGCGVWVRFRVRMKLTLHKKTTQITMTTKFTSLLVRKHHYFITRHNREMSRFIVHHEKYWKEAHDMRLRSNKLANSIRIDLVHNKILTSDVWFPPPSNVLVHSIFFVTLSMALRRSYASHLISFIRENVYHVSAKRIWTFTTFRVSKRIFTMPLIEQSYA